MRTTALLAITMLLPFAAQADVTGTWTASFDTQVGKQEYTYELKVDGNALTGTAKSANGEVALESGKVDGNTVSFVEKLTFQGMPLVITYTGNVVSDDEIQFKRDVAGLVTEDVTARRAK